MDPTVFTPLPGPEPAVGARHTDNALVGAIANAHYARSAQFEAAIHALQAQGPDSDVASLENGDHTAHQPRSARYR